MLHFAVLLLSCLAGSVSGELGFLFRDLEALRNDLPANLITVADHQLTQLEVIKMGMEYIDQVDKVLPSKAPKVQPNATRAAAPVSVPVHVDVVLIGFDSRSLDMINDDWFQKLNMEERVEATIGGQSAPVGGAPTVDYKFRLVHVSFHVQKAIGLFIQHHIRRINSLPTSGHYVNAQEMEPLLEDLSLAIYGVGGTFGVAATLFVLNHVGADGNIGSAPWSGNYGYKSGYSVADLKGLADDREVLDACFKVTAAAKAMTKVDLEASAVPAAPAGRLNSGERAPVLDAVHMTRLWSVSLREQLEKEKDMSLSQHVLSTLTKEHPEGSSAYWRKVALARDVVSVFDGSTEDNGPEELPHCTSQSWFARERIVWSDLSANGAKPLVSSIDSRTMFTVPHALPAALAHDPGGQREEVITSASSAAKKVQAGLRMLFARFKQLKSVAAQLDCDLAVVDEDPPLRSPDPSNPSWKTGLQHVGSTVVGALNRNSPTCSHLTIRLGLIKHMLSAQEDMGDLLTGLKQQSDGSLNDIVMLESRMQMELLRAIKEDLVHHDNAEHVARPYTLSDAVEQTPIHKYMGELSNLIINLAEQAVAPPITLSTYQSSDIDSGKDEDRSPAEQAQMLFNAYHSTPSLLKASQSYVKPPRSVESFSLYELVEEHIASADYANAKMMNPILRSIIDRPGFDTISDFEANLLPLFVPDMLEITVFLIVLQQAYKPIGVEGMDASALLSELQRFKLSSQRMALTMHTNDIKGEDRLMRALLACRRSVHKKDGHQQNHVYLDPWCLWGHVKDEEETRRNIKSSKTLQRVPIFIFSVDFPNPLYLGRDYATSVSVGEAVLVVQNSQKEIQTGLYCGENPASINGRNPLAPLLMSVGNSIAGLTHSYAASSRYASASTVHLCGQSPVFSGIDVSRPSFSALDMDASYRNRLLRSVAASEWLIRQKWEAALLSSHEWSVLVNFHSGEHNESALLAKLRNRFEDFVPQELVKLREETIFYIQYMDWVRGSKSSNILLGGALNLAADDFKYSLVADDSVDALLDFKARMREREGSLLKRLKKEVSAVAENNETVRSLGRYLIGALCACLCYFAAGYFWNVAIDSSKPSRL